MMMNYFSTFLVLPEGVDFFGFESDPMPINYFQILSGHLREVDLFQCQLSLTLMVGRLFIWIKIIFKCFKLKF